jgi:hypothetical protein
LCLIVATRYPLFTNSGISFSNKVVLPELDLPTIDTIGVVMF